MAKARKKLVALRFGHATPFRRTVTSGGEPKTIVFAPGEVVDISQEEAGQLQRELDAGLLIDPASDRRYAKSMAEPDRESLAPETDSE
jgi:hypothetical protein